MVCTVVVMSNFSFDSELTKLIQLESDAKVQGKGKWTKTHTNNVSSGGFLSFLFL